MTINRNSNCPQFIDISDWICSFSYVFWWYNINSLVDVGLFSVKILQVVVILISSTSYLIGLWRLLSIAMFNWRLAICMRRFEITARLCLASRRERHTGEVNFCTVGSDYSKKSHQYWKLWFLSCHFDWWQEHINIPLNLLLNVHGLFCWAFTLSL